VRQHERAAQLLVGVADVEAEPEVQLDRLVELRLAKPLQQANGLDRRVDLLALEARGRCDSACRAATSEIHLHSHRRAVPAMIFAAWSMSRAFRSGIFVSAIRCTCSRERRPTFSRFGSPEPLSSRSASLIRTACRRRLRDERERAILEDGDLDRGDAAVLVGRLRVERLAELHDVDAVLAERRGRPAGPGSPGRRGSGA
jgi:hypothetical protein